MAQRKTLNDVQVSLLRWIDQGCPETGVDGVSARISAGALRNRGFVRTSGRGQTWKATITDAGKEYLQQVDGPNPPQPRQANVSVTQQLVDEVVAAGGSLACSAQALGREWWDRLRASRAACREPWEGSAGEPFRREAGLSG